MRAHGSGRHQNDDGRRHGPPDAESHRQCLPENRSKWSTNWKPAVGTEAAHYMPLDSDLGPGITPGVVDRTNLIVRAERIGQTGSAPDYPLRRRRDSAGRAAATRTAS